MAIFTLIMWLKKKNSHCLSHDQYERDQDVGEEEILAKSKPWIGLNETPCTQLIKWVVFSLLSLDLLLAVLNLTWPNLAHDQPHKEC